MDEQVAECNAEAERRGWTVAATYIDRNKSASKAGTVRPDYERLLADIEGGRVSRLLVYMTDRLYRQPRELEDLIDLVDPKKGGHAVEFATVRSGTFDLSTPEGRAFARNAGTWNKLESEKTSERVRRTKKTRREEGRLNGGGRRSFGYRPIKGNRLEVVPEEAALLREAVDRIIGGEPHSRVVMDWNDRGITTEGGYRWRPEGLKRKLIDRNGKSETGGRTLRGTPLIVGGKDWPAIITKDEATLLAATLIDAKPGGLGGGREPGSARPGARKYALSGLLLCSECGSKMLGSSGYYECAAIGGGCGRVSVKARHLEDVLDGYVEQERDTGRARDPEAYVPVPAGDPEEREAVLAELAALQTEVEDLADQLRAAKTGLAKRVVQRAIDKAAAADDAARARLAMLVPEAQPASYADLLADDDFHERWINRELTTTELTDLHDMFAAYFESVTISPRVGRPKRLDPGRIKVQWREGRPPAVDPRPMESDTVFKSESDRSVSVTRVA